MANHLANESSPYLLQHANNPVEWFPWGDAAFRKAAAEHKPIFLSIGYSTCHWCHVMEGDSFEKEDVAEILNKHFVAIKVDREERPDVDGFYLKAVQAMNQRGGWPLSVILTDEGQPFWGGTFFPREQLKGILNRIHEIWLTENHVLKDNAFELTEHLKLKDEELFEKKSKIDLRVIESFLKSKIESFDAQLGGFGSAPKFPPSMALMVLLRYPEHRSMAFKTLNSMARGGMRDQVGGGFHRYSVDDKWLVPHFEKMLYDNALLTLAYCDAYQAGEGKNREYEYVITSTLDYVLRDMMSSGGAFFSAEDADSEKTEGKFYVWKKEDFSPQLLQRVEEFFTLNPEGNFVVAKHVEELEAAAGMSAVQNANILHNMNAVQIPREESYKKLMGELLELRAKRIRPSLDDKILTSWNGWMIAAFAKAGRTLQSEKFTVAAEKAMNFVLTKLTQNDMLLRTYRDGVAKQESFLEDYAAVIFANIELYLSTLNPKYLQNAIIWQKKQDDSFLDRKTQAYFEDRGTDIRIPIRSKEFMDDATPGGNSLSAWNLSRLFKMTGDTEWRNRCIPLLEQSSELMQRYPAAFPLMNMALAELHGKSLVIVGNFDIKNLPKSVGFTTWLQAHADLVESCPILQEKVPIAGKTQYFLCEGEQCQLPTLDFQSILKELTS